MAADYGGIASGALGVVGTLIGLYQQNKARQDAKNQESNRKKMELLTMAMNMAGGKGIGAPGTPMALPTVDVGGAIGNAGKVVGDFNNAYKAQSLSEANAGAYEGDSAYYNKLNKLAVARNSAAQAQIEHQKRMYPITEQTGVAQLGGTQAETAYKQAETGLKNKYGAAQAEAGINAQTATTTATNADVANKNALAPAQLADVVAQTKQREAATAKDVVEARGLEEMGPGVSKLLDAFNTSMRTYQVTGDEADLANANMYGDEIQRRLKLKKGDTTTAKPVSKGKGLVPGFTPSR